MALSVNNNIAALNTYRNLTTTQSSLGKSLEKLSSGYRINRAADDAAGLAISEGLRSQVSGLTQASRNAQDGINVVQTAEGALNESTSILQRMRTLAVQAASSGSLSDDAVKNIQAEVGQLKDELTRIAKTTSFNGKNLLDGTAGSLSFQVGANSGQTLNVDLSSAMDAAGLGVDGVDFTKSSTVVTADTATYTGPDAATGAGAKLDLNVASTFNLTTNAADFQKLKGTINIGTKSFDLGAVKYGDADDAAARLTTLQDALDAKFGANVVVVDATDGAGKFTIDNSTAQATDTNTDTVYSSKELAAVDVSFTAASGASEALDLLDKAIQTVSSSRASLGAVQNRLEHTIANIGVATENLTASESSIRDTDMASEMVKFTSRQILAQAGTAMLAQAKNLPQGVLSLLQN